MPRQTVMTASSHRGRPVMLVHIALLALLAVAGCDTDDHPSAGTATDRIATVAPAASAVAPPGPAPSTPAGPPVVYPVPAKGCDGVETAVLDKVLGTVKHRREQVRRSALLANATCSVDYATHILIMRLDVIQDGSGELMYHGLRNVHQKDGPVTDVPGVGSGAYAYTDPSTGPHLAAWDGNLYISAGLTPITGTSAPAAANELPVVVSATLTKLHP